MSREMVRQSAKMHRFPVLSDPPPRWSYYHTFDDRVWVRKGGIPCFHKQAWQTWNMRPLLHHPLIWPDHK